MIEEKVKTSTQP